MSVQQATLMAFSGSGEAPGTVATEMTKVWVLSSRNSVQLGRQTWTQVIPVQSLRDEG